MKVLNVLLAVFIPAVCSSAQNSGLQFEVASVRQNQISAGGISRKLYPGNLNYTNIALGEFFEVAYGTTYAQMTGPDWLFRDRYDIVAKAEGPASEREVRLMLRALLEDRFKVTLHREIREAPVLALVVTKNGPKFHASAAETRETQFSRTGFEYKNWSMADFARMLTLNLVRIIVDRTGLEGRYDFTLNIYDLAGNSKQAVADAFEDSLPTALNDLGLKFESQRAPVEFMVIDHMERVPTEN